MRIRLIAGNWKMHKTVADLEPYFIGLDSAFYTRQVEVMIAAPFTLLTPARQFAEAEGVKIAAQNVHWEPSGAFTGEISVPMLKDLGVSATLIGHSERRQYFSETDETVAKKVRAVLDGGITPILCVGESLDERERGVTNSVIRRQVLSATEGLPSPGPMIIAYEPVWAIGTGRNATAAQAQSVHSMIRSVIGTRFSNTVADGMRVLYGGSANPSNIKDFLEQPDIDGALVGGASLKAGDFREIIRLAAN